MEDDPATPKPKAQESISRNREGYIQLAEKMEQVKNQMAKMERKYDELYQSVKEANKLRDEATSKDSISSEDQRPLSEPMGKVGMRSAKPSFASESGSERSFDDPPNPTPSLDLDLDLNTNTNPTKPTLDVEKMEDNPFM